MSFRIVCLMNMGRMTDEMRTKILETALRMSQKGRRSGKIKTDTYEGVVTTKGERASLVFFSGVVFEATVESSLGKATIRFIADVSFGPEVVEEEGAGWMSEKDFQRAQNAYLN